MKKLLRSRPGRDTVQQLLLLVLIGVMLLVFSSQSPYFLGKRNLLNIAKQIAEIGFISVALSMTVITGNVDIAVGSVLGLSSILLAKMLLAGTPIAVAVLVTLLIGIVLGAFNGYFVGKLGMQGIVVTIGSSVLIRGFCYIVTGGRPVSGLPQAFLGSSAVSVLSLPLSFVVLLLLFVAAEFAMRKTFIGEYGYAIGNNQQTALYSGVPVSSFKLGLFALNGLMSALAAIFLLARLGSAEASSGTGIEMDALTSVLIGGISIFGGKGRVINTLLGLVLIGILRNGFNLIGISSLYQSVILGFLIILTIAQWRGNKTGT